MAHELILKNRMALSREHTSTMAQLFLFELTHTYHQPKYTYLLYLCIIHYFIKLIKKNQPISQWQSEKRKKSILDLFFCLYPHQYLNGSILGPMETHHSNLWHHYISNYLLLKAIFFISFPNLQVLFALDFLNLMHPPSLSLLCNSNSVQLWKYHLNSLNVFHVKSRV